MDNCTRDNPKVITAKRYLILGRPAAKLLFCLGTGFYYLYCMLMPIFYTLENHFPAEQDIHYTEGLFTYRKSGKNNYQIGVITKSNTDFFSCKSSYPDPDLCEVDRQYHRQLEDELRKNNQRTDIILEPKIYQKWQGKPARIGWFIQKYSLFSTDRRVVQVIVDGNEVVSNENVSQHIIRSKNSWILDLIMSSPLLIITIYLTIDLILNKDIKNEKQNHWSRIW